VHAIYPLGLVINTEGKNINRGVLTLSRTLLKWYCESKTEKI